jgi:hypothetical protein
MSQELMMLERLPLERGKQVLTEVIQDPVQLKMMLNDIDRNCRKPYDVMRMYWNSRLSSEGMGVANSSWSQRKKVVVG